MPLSELYRSVDGKKEHSQQKSNDVSYIPNDEFVELIWERGQVMVQGQSSKIKKIPVSSNFQFQTSKHQEKDDLLDVHGLNQDDDDDMVPWLNYPLDDYCSDLLPELSGITVHEPPSRVHKDPGSVITGLDHSNTSKGSSRTGNLFTFSDPTVRLGVSDIGNSSRSKPHNTVHRDPVGGGEKTILNFSHFSRPAAKAMAKANVQNQDHVHHGAVNHEPRKETGQPSSDPVKAGPNLSTKPVDEPHCVDKSTNDVNGGKETVKSNEPIRACSSVCSGNSAERASNDLTKSFKRKSRDMEDFECQSQGDEEESLGTKTARGSRNRTGSKRSRAAEVHNLSERRRRDRINEKMRALQELIPNCNKVDKASMLDEAIEYLKTLQLQVQIMSMGTGLCMPPMMFPSGMQHMSHMGIGMGMGYGMGMGMDAGPHMFPFSPTAHGSRHPSIYGHPSQGMPVLIPQTHMPGIPIYPPVRQVDVPDMGPSSKDLMHNKNPNAMAQTSSQSQDANKSLNRSTSVDT